VDLTSEPDFLQLALDEEHAARNSPSAEARKRHEALAIAFEIRCLGTYSSLSAILDEAPSCWLSEAVARRTNADREVMEVRP
jgi:hypothetical protein